MKKVRVVFVALFVLALVLAACKPGGESTAVIMRIGMGGAPDTLNPCAALLTEAFEVFELAYSSVYEHMLDGSYQLDLGESMTASEDMLTYTIKIKEGVQWSDGEPLTAEDVAFTYNLNKNHEDFPYQNSYAMQMESITALDEYTIEIKMLEVVPDIRYQLTFMYILPEHIWGPVEEAGTSLEFSNFPFIGSGAFNVVDYAQGEYVHFVKNPNWYGIEPKIDEVVFQTFENQEAMVQAIKTGDVDVITEMPLTAVASLEEAANVEVVTGTPFAPDITDIIINQVEPENCPPGDGLCTGHPALLDLEVRKALAFATNKQQLIDVVLLGLGTRGVTLIPDSLAPYFNTTIEDFPYDVAEANNLLDTAGYMDTTGDEIREMPDGSRDLTFRINWPSDSTIGDRIAQLLAEQWKQIGVKLELQALDPDTLSSICCPTFDYDILIWGWGSDPDPSFLLSTMITDEIPTGMSETGYSNPEFDQLYYEQSVTVDPEARKAIVWEMQEMVFEDVVYIIPFYAMQVQAYRSDRFENWPLDMPKLALEDINSLLLVSPVP